MSESPNDDTKMRRRFTDRQLKFMRAYVVSGNATQAAIEAGYSSKSAHVQGSRMLRDVKVKEMVDKTLKRIAERQRTKEKT